MDVAIVVTLASTVLFLIGKGLGAAAAKGSPAALALDTRDPDPLAAPASEVDPGMVTPNREVLA